MAATSGSFTLRVSTLALRLPHALSRAAAVGEGANLLVLGGLGPAGSSNAILRLNPAAATVSSVGTLPAAVHDTAAAPLGTGFLLIGGGRTLAVGTVQQVTATGTAVLAKLRGTLPAARADLAAVEVGAEILVVGGGRGGIPDPSVLATTDGTVFRAVGRLAVAVRYPAVVARGGVVYLFGGAMAGGDTTAIQALNPATGSVRIVGHLPAAVDGASAFDLGGLILIAGGFSQGRAVDTILTFNPATGMSTVVGHLPAPRAYAAVAVVGSTAYLAGGEAGGQRLDTVAAVAIG